MVRNDFAVVSISTNPMLMRSLFPVLKSLSLPAFALLLASCAGTQNATRGQTQYLDAFNPGTVPQTSAGVVDTVSYWDGDAVAGSPSIVLKLGEQKAYFYKGGQLAGVSLICSGNEEHRTVTGNFKIFEKDIDHKSNLYGDFVDSAGNIVKANVDATKDKAPPGTKFDGSKMHHFMRFNGGAGMHEGFMAGYPASHGCVRMPAHMATIFYNNVALGTPVKVIQ